MDRIIILKTNFIKDKLIAIHALEIINYEMTGLYFHAFFNKKFYTSTEMYYYSEYECDDDNYYLEQFKNFVGSSKIISFNENINLLNSFFEGMRIDNILNEKDLFDVAREYGIEVDNSSHEGLIDCTILGRIICIKNNNIENEKKEKKNN